MSLGRGYDPTTRTKTLHLKLGYVGSVATLTGTALEASFSTLPWGVTPTFQVSDVGTQISIIGAGADPPVIPAFGPRGKMLVTTVVSVGDGTHATLGHAASNTPQDSAANVVLYRGVSARTGTIRYNAELSTTMRETLSFTVTSEDGSMVAYAGMPVYLYDEVLGDVFGGSIDQVKISNVGNSMALFFECQCVSWAKLLDKRIISPYLLTQGVFQRIHVGDIVNHLVYDYCDSEGLTTETPPGSPSGVFVDQFVAGAGSSSIAQALDQLAAATYTSTVAYSWYVDAWRRVKFLPTEDSPAPWTVDEAAFTDRNVLVQLGITTSREKLANRNYLDCQNALETTIRTESDSLLARFPNGTFPKFSGNAPYSTNVQSKVSTTPVIILRVHKYLDWGNGLTFVKDPNLFNPMVDAPSTPPYTPYTDYVQTVTLQGFPPGTAKFYWAINSTTITIDALQTFLTGDVSDSVTSFPVNDGTQVKAGNRYRVDAEIVQALADGAAGPCSVSFQRSVPNVGSSAARAHFGGVALVQFTQYPYPWIANPYGSGLTFVEFIIQYQTGQNQTFFASNDDSVGKRLGLEGGTGYWEAQNSSSAPNTVPGCQALALAQATYFGTPTSTFEFETYKPGLALGQTLTVNVSSIGISDTAFLIDQITLYSDGNYQKWGVHCVNGAVIGDWRRAFLNLISPPAIGATSGPPGPTGPQGPEGSTTTPPYIWSPGYAQPVAGDALETADGFGIQPIYETLADGSAGAFVAIKGVPPINQVSESVLPPSIQVLVVPGGGSIPAGTYAVGADAYDNSTLVRNYGVSALSAVVEVVVASPSSLVVTGVSTTVGGSYLISAISSGVGSFEVSDPSLYLVGQTLYCEGEQMGPISGIAGNTISAARGVNGTAVASHALAAQVFVVGWLGVDGGDVYVANVADGSNPGTTKSSAWHYEAHVLSGSTGVMLSSLSGASSGAPDARADHFGVDVQKVEKVGCFTAQVASRTSDTLTFASATFGVNQWASRIAILLAHVDILKDVEIANLPVLSNTADTLTIGPNSAGEGPPDLTTFIDVGDWVTISIQPTAVTANGFVDVNLVNFFESGLTAHEEIGKFALVWEGTGKGQPAILIGDNTSTGVTLSADWEILPDSTSIILILGATIPTFRTMPFQIPNKTTFTGIVAQPNVQNLADQTWLFSVYVEDAANGRGVAASQRIGRILGSQGPRTIVVDDTMRITDGIVLVDTSTPSHPTAPTTLAVDITTITSEDVHLTDGSGTFYNTDFMIGTERFRITSGQGTNNVITKRGVAGTIAAVHTAGDAVTLAGYTVFTLLTADDAPNHEVLVHKITTDVNFADVATGGSGPRRDKFSDGSTDWFLPDNSDVDGTATLTLVKQ